MTYSISGNNNKNPISPVLDSCQDLVVFTFIVMSLNKVRYLIYRQAPNIYNVGSDQNGIQAYLLGRQQLLNHHTFDITASHLLGSRGSTVCR